MQREAMEFDVLIVVVGPARLAAEERELPGASVSLSIREQKAMTANPEFLALGTTPGGRAALSGGLVAP